MSLSDGMKKRNNIHLIRAKHSLDDEFYTSYEHAKQVITPFAKHFSGKSILCNCDNPDTSEVFDFMRDSFDAFKLSKLVGVGYGSRMQVITKDGIEDIEVKNNGDFRTGESLEALKACDGVVSNPPFSLPSNWTFLLAFTKVLIGFTKLLAATQ